MVIQDLLNKRERISWYSGIILMLIFLYFGILLSPSIIVNKISLFSFYITAGLLSFLIFYSKKAHYIRWLMLFIMAVVFFISFISEYFVVRGHIGIQEQDILNGLPFCHIAIINQLFSLPVLKYFVNPAQLAGGDKTIYPMVIIWLWSTILIGKGWCSWACFYGGWDTFFSNLRKKPLVNISPETAAKLRFIPYALLVVFALLSLMLLEPVFCLYICPFKTITEFRQVTTLSTWIIFFVTVGGFISFCITLPLIFGKRIWCAYLCPFGALQGLVGKLFKIFRMKIDDSKCTNCQKCVNVCRVEGVTAESLKNKKFTANCSLCTSCVYECPKKAITVAAFYNENSISKLIEKMTFKLSEVKFLKNIRAFLIAFIDDIMNPLSILYFFCLAVYFTFFSTFYFSAIKFLTIIFGG